VCIDEGGENLVPAAGLHKQIAISSVFGTHRWGIEGHREEIFICGEKILGWVESNETQ